MQGREIDVVVVVVVIVFAAFFEVIVRERARVGLYPLNSCCKGRRRERERIWGES